jgi:hypothetical protein
MPEIQVRHKEIDILTGNEKMVNRVFKINESSPENSIEYHKLADLMRINGFDRLNPHISTKLALIYNWAASTTNSNDVEKICNYVNKCAKNLGVMEVGKGLVDGLYRVARFDMQSADYDERLKGSKEAIKAINNDLRGDKKDARDLRKQAGNVNKTTEQLNKDTERTTKEAYKDFKEQLPSESKIRIKVLDQGPLVERYKYG